MTYKEEVKDLFSVSDDYYLAHCISSDFGMGKGIVVEFNNRFDLKNKLVKKYHSFVKYWDFADDDKKGTCLLEGRVFNLITKRNYWHKPNYKNVRNALEGMKVLCINNKVEKLAMPKIAAGLDQLQWDKVSEIIKEVFEDMDIYILVCKQS